MALWIWTLLISVPFGYAAYHQAAKPDWKMALSALPLAAIGLGYIFFAAPDELVTSKEIFTAHPHDFKFRAATIAVGVTILALASAFIGHLFRKKYAPVQIGVSAFLAAFVPLNIIYFLGATS